MWTILLIVSLFLVNYFLLLKVTRQVQESIDIIADKLKMIVDYLNGEE